MTGAGPAAASLLYDARRGVYYTRPALRGWLHLLTAAWRLRLRHLSRQRPRRRGLPIRGDSAIYRLRLRDGAIHLRPRTARRQGRGPRR
jgi:hypothetical protein